MKVELSKQLSDWLQDKINRQFIKGVDGFLHRVANASDVSQITPKAKAAGKNLGIGGTVPEFTIGRCRIYGRMFESATGEKIMRLAVVGTKGITNQNDDIKNAVLALEGKIDAQWSKWEPVTDDVVAELVASEPVEIAPAPQSMVAPKKSSGKGKPVDENGLTAKERKRLQKEQRMTEQLKIQAEKQAKLKAEKQAQESQADATQPPVPLEPVAPEPTVAPVPADASVAETPEKTAEQTIVSAAPEVSAPHVTINGVAQPAPAEMPTNANFADMSDISLELELLEHYMLIESSKIAIAQHKIELEQAKIAREMLEIKKLKLLQLQKHQNLQK